MKYEVWLWWRPTIVSVKKGCFKTVKSAEYMVHELERSRDVLKDPSVQCAQILWKKVG